MVDYYIWHRLQVRESNDKYYFLTFPELEQAKSLCENADEKCLCWCNDVKTIEALISRHSMHKSDASISKCGEQNDAGYFSICGMIDGTTEIVNILDNGEWVMEQIVVEVKNRMRSFRNPLPLYDCIQMAVYMKMLGLRHGDMIQCLNEDQTNIQISRVSLDHHPLASSAELSCECSNASDLWQLLIVPRMYEYVHTIYKFREHDLLRLSFLNATPKEQLKMLREQLSFV